MAGFVLKNKKRLNRAQGGQMGLDALVDGKLRGRLEGDRPEAVMKMQYEGFRVLLHGFRCDPAANQPIPAASSLNGSAGFPGQALGGGFKELLTKKWPGPRDFVEVNAARVVVLMQGGGDLELTAREEALVRCDLRKPRGVILPVQITPAAIETAVVNQPPRIETRKNVNRKTLQKEDF